MQSIIPVLGMALLLGLGAGAWNLRDDAMAFSAMDFPVERIERHATPTLISELDALAPGGTSWIAVRFEISSGWHLYWNGRNDSGSAPTLAVSLPPGYTLGAWIWPAPVRLVSPGEILDHVYEGSVVLMAPLSVPKDAKIGSAAAISVEAGWLACDQNVCVAESATIRSEFLVRAAPAPGKDASGFRAARTRHPKPWPKDSKDFVATTSASGAARLATIRVVGATHLEFYPLLSSVGVKDLFRGGVANGDTLTLASAGAAGGDAHFRGVLAVTRRGDAAPEFYEMDFPHVGKASAGVGQDSPGAK